MRVETFDYELKPESIAQIPLEERDLARLLVLPRDGDAQHRAVRDLPSLLPSGAVVVLNDTRVIPARVVGTKEGSGGKAEVFLLRRLDRAASEPSAPLHAERWEAMGRASKGLPKGSVILCPPLRIRVLGPSPEPHERGLLEVVVESDGPPLALALASVGHVPLPPYIRRPDDAGDRARYQTVFARVDGAVAAPTAGLHFTESLLAELEARGLSIAFVTLHVGLGTFQPVTAEDLDAHPMHEESFEIPSDTAEAIRDARRRNGPIVAVGTTVVRALESAADPDHPGLVSATRGTTRLLIQPGYRFRVVDRLVTNFHVPRSTLLALVCAFGGTARVLDAYRLAQREGYRFFSYGDAMLLEGKSA
jgi:S-adenosylmethionine:tRNA ribosyltransferase-isomerase